MNNVNVSDAVPFDVAPVVLHGVDYYNEIVSGKKFKVNQSAFL